MILIWAVSYHFFDGSFSPCVKVNKAYRIYCPVDIFDPLTHHDTIDYIVPQVLYLTYKHLTTLDSVLTNLT